MDSIIHRRDAEGKPIDRKDYRLAIEVHKGIARNLCVSAPSRLSVFPVLDIYP